MNCCECNAEMQWQEWADIKSEMAAYGCPVPDDCDPVCMECIDSIGEELEGAMMVEEWAMMNVGLN